jgi:hypothetical protein
MTETSSAKVYGLALSRQTHGANREEPDTARATSRDIEGVIGTTVNDHCGSVWRKPREVVGEGSGVSPAQQNTV